MANNIYMLSIQPNAKVNDEFIIKKLNTAADWIQIFPYAFIFTSSRSAKEWTDLVKPGIVPSLYFISEIDISNRGGWLPKWAWDRLRKYSEQNSNQIQRW